MSTNSLEERIAIAQEALRSFLATLLETDAFLEFDAPATADFDDAADRSLQNIAFSAGTSPADQWAVVLDPDWLPHLSKSMLGEAIEFGDPGADDLLRELAAQAHGAVRTQLSSAGVQLPEVQMVLLDAGDRLAAPRFSPMLFEIPFQLTVDGTVLAGYALVPPVDDPPATIDPPVIPQSETADEAPGDVNAGVGSPPASQKSARPSPRSEPGIPVRPAAFPDLGSEAIGGDGSTAGFELLAEVELEVTVELGRRSLALADVLRLTTGSVIELDKLVGEPLEVYANGRLIAEGEAVVMDEQFGIRITNLASGRARAKAFM